MRSEKGDFNYVVKEEREKIRADVKDKEHIHFTIEIDTEGDVGESLVSRDYLDEKVLNKAEKEVEKSIQELAQKTVTKLHEGFKVDAIGVGRYLKESEPKVWKQVEKDWDHGKNYFAKSTIDVKVQAQIRGIGSISQTKK